MSTQITAGSAQTDAAHAQRQALAKSAAPAPQRGEVIDHPASADLQIARLAARRPRHWAAAISFLAVVAAPTLGSVGYLYGFAVDQYHSEVAFSIRSAEARAPVEFLGALATGGSSSIGLDAEVIYEFLRSQQMVETAMAALPFERFYNAPHGDYVFALGEDRPIEEVVDYWNWMTDVSYDAGSGIVTFESRAFEPEHAQAIAALALEESTKLVNMLSLQAREDAVGVAREVLAASEDRLRDIRRRIRAFRDLEQELDPTMNAAAALSLVAALETDLARARIELDSQLQLVGERSPRVAVLRQNIQSLEKQIEEERQRLGAGLGASQEAGGRPLADLLAEYEDLEVDREFAQNAYLSSLEAFEKAQIEARRQMRYLAPHIQPTLSVEAQYPQRALLSLGVFALLLVGWATALLIYYNIRDRS